MGHGEADCEQGTTKRPPWFVAARERAMELAEAQVDDADIERVLRHEYPPDYAGRPNPTKQDLARRAERVATLVRRWADQLEDARASGRAKLQVRLATLAHADGPAATRAATFLAREHVSIVNLDRDVARELKRLSSMSPEALADWLQRLVETTGRGAH